MCNLLGEVKSISRASGVADHIATLSLVGQRLGDASVGQQDRDAHFFKFLNFYCAQFLVLDRAAMGPGPVGYGFGPSCAPPTNVRFEFAHGQRAAA